MSTTQLNYDMVPDKSPLYTTVDQLNQSTADLQVTAQNSTHQPVTISEILIELVKVEQGTDRVQLLLPGSAGGIQLPNSVTGPGQATWTVTSPDDGQFLFKADGAGATFQAGDTLSFTLQNVVIREGGTGTAFVPIHEGSGADRSETEVGIGITESSLDVELKVDHTLTEPGQIATLTWVTNDASSGVLTMPGNSPSLLTLDSTNLAHGQQPVSPIENTTYSLTCQGRGPSVTQQVDVSIDEVTASFFGSDNGFGANQSITLSWQTSKAVSCAISLQESPNDSVKVPFTNGQTVSCNVGATPDAQTLILTSADGSHRELGRLTLPTPCPLSVTFVLTVEGIHTSTQPTLTVNLLRPQINTFNPSLSSHTATYQGPSVGIDPPDPVTVTFYSLQLTWDVSYASAVLVACNGNQVSTAPSGTWESGDSMSIPSGTITCQGFGGPVGH